MSGFNLSVVLLLVSLFANPSALAAVDCTLAPSAEKGQSLERLTLKDLARDQACIWTSPVHLSENRNWTLFVPWAGATAALISTDRAVVRAVPDAPSTLNRAKHISDAAFLGELGVGGVLYLTGLARSSPRMRETGWLAGEAIANALAVNLATQAVSRRNRPNDIAKPGEWFQSGRAFSVRSLDGVLGSCDRDCARVSRLAFPDLGLRNCNHSLRCSSTCAATLAVGCVRRQQYWISGRALRLHVASP